jgi:hypothetical protein
MLEGAEAALVLCFGPAITCSRAHGFTVVRASSSPKSSCRWESR